VAISYPMFLLFVDEVASLNSDGVGSNISSDVASQAICIYKFSNDFGNLSLSEGGS